MRIYLCAIFAPSGSRDFTFSEIPETEADSILETAVSSISNLLLDTPSSAHLGLIHRSVSIQLYGYVSCTGWIVILGLEHGPFDSADISRAFIDKVYSSVVDSASNPFFSSLRDSSAFNSQFKNYLESHCAMMKFMATAGVVG